ncbi:MAG: sulfite exporter TauE/SafE family protein [Gammaproteobacteria bacterium]|nr:sulfite exporter TauE/SafE family protein [Gammaproteobacteria bacterium]
MQQLNWANTLAGFGVGVLVGITGVGGGSLMTPILVLLFGVAPAAAIGTDLWFAAVTKIVGGAIHHKLGSVDWQVLRRMWLGSLPAAVLTLWWMHSTGIAQSRPRVLLIVLGGVLLLTSVAMQCMGRTHAMAQRLRSSSPDRFLFLQPGVTVLAGALLGILVTLTSVSAGALGTALLLYIYPFRMKAARMVGTDIVHAIPLTLLAGTGYMLMGNVNFPLLGNLLLGSIPGIVAGSLIASKTREGALRTCIALLLAVVGIKLTMT